MPLLSSVYLQYSVSTTKMQFMFHLMSYMDYKLLSHPIIYRWLAEYLTLSYYHQHEIESVNFKSLFLAMSWNKNTRCMFLPSYRLHFNNLKQALDVWVFYLYCLETEH